MKENLIRRLLVLFAMILGLGGLSVILNGLAAADTASPGTGGVSRLAERGLEPVIIAGEDVSALIGLPVDQLFVYAHVGGVWRQIPAQVDEITAAGDYTATEDGLLDANDEILFMARDLGDRTPSTVPILGSLRIVSDWYEIEVTDPLSPTQRGWAYLIHSSVLTSSAAVDYVGFDHGFHRINAVDYSLGFGVTHVGVDFLTLGGSKVEILDRTKMRLDCTIPVVCPITENAISPFPDNLIKDGPVRIIARGGEVLAYGSMLRWTAFFSFSQSLSGDVRFSADFNQAVSGATYYNRVVTEGVTVDGIADTVPAAPRSHWWQLSAASGTIVHVADTSSIGGIQSNYYVDNSARDESDTGDLRHFGDAGVSIENPSIPFTYSVTAYFLPGSRPNVGSAYESFCRHPLLVTTRVYSGLRPQSLYFPLVLRSVASGGAVLERGGPSRMTDP